MDSTMLDRFVSATTVVNTAEGDNETSVEKNESTKETLLKQRLYISVCVQYAVNNDGSPLDTIHDSVRFKSNFAELGDADVM